VDLPVTVKTRLGWDDNSINIDEVAERLQDIGVAALSIHERSNVQGHSDWSHCSSKKTTQNYDAYFGNEILTALKSIKI
jgi:tRNA-dihydrouridine synthase